MSRAAAGGPAIDATAMQAAEWIVRLTADDPAERERAREGFETWKQADPRRAAAAAGMERLLGQLQTVRESSGGHARPAHAALTASAAEARPRQSRRRRQAGATLALALALGLFGGMLLRACPPAYLLADMRTATGDTRAQVLPDGSRISLDTGSAVNLHYDAGHRDIELVRGAIRVEVAPDAARPFVVRTPQGSIRALGTRFIVRRGAEATELTMLESRTTVQAGAGAEARVVGPGQRVRITEAGIGPAEPVDVRSIDNAWTRRQLVADDRPLPEVLDELDRYHPGGIVYDRARTQGIRVSAVLPLDDTTRALQLLVDSFPQLRVRTLTSYLVLVDTTDPS